MEKIMIIFVSIICLLMTIGCIGLGFKLQDLFITVCATLFSYALGMLMGFLIIKTNKTI